jgi:hypothetical protein
LPLVSAQACYRAWPRRRRSRCRKIPERTREISGRKRKPRSGGRRDDLPIDRLPIDDLPITGIAVAAAVGSAGGIAAVAGAAGDGNKLEVGADLKRGERHDGI